MERKERDIIKIDAIKILEEAHEKLEIEYQNGKVLKKAKDNADKLSRFFSNIKKYANYQDQSKVPIYYLAILKEIQSHSKKLNLNRLFRVPGKIGGILAERQMARIMHATTSLVFKDTKITGKIKQYQTGYDQIVLEEITEDIAKEIFNTLPGEVKKELDLTEEQFTKQQIDYVKIHSKLQGKPDNRGLKLEYNVQAVKNPQYLDIFSLLNKCVFSLKSYASLQFDHNIKQYSIKKRTDQLKLGSTDAKKAITSALISLGQDIVTATACYYIATNSKNNEAINKQHLGHLKFYYELTGAGSQQIINNELMDMAKVDYLVYNDPVSDHIAVKSSAELISEALNKELNGATMYVSRF